MLRAYRRTWKCRQVGMPAWPQWLGRPPQPGLRASWVLAFTSREMSRIASDITWRRLTVKRFDDKNVGARSIGRAGPCPSIESPLHWRGRKHAAISCSGQRGGIASCRIKCTTAGMAGIPDRGLGDGLLHDLDRDGCGVAR